MCCCELGREINAAAAIGQTAVVDFSMSKVSRSAPQLPNTFDRIDRENYLHQEQQMISKNVKKKAASCKFFFTHSH